MMKKIKIEKPYSELTEEDIWDICTWFLRRLGHMCEACPLQNTKHCLSYFEPNKDAICKCEIEKEV
jgi:hypothetical protein